MKNLLKVFTPLLIGSIIGLTTSSYIDLEYINKPFLTPPKIVFPIVWTILYLLIGFSWYLYNKYKKENNISINILYYLSLFFNYMWTIIFFVFKLRFLSIIWILLLDLLIILLIIKYKKLNYKSYYLNIPYLIWLLLATYLTIGIYILN